MNTPAISVQGVSEGKALAVIVSEEITNARDLAVMQSRNIRKAQAIADDTGLQLAVDAAADLKRVRKEVEAARKAAKKPIDDLGKMILRKEEEFLRDVETEETQLTGMINHYQRRKLEEEEKRTAAAVQQVTAQTGTVQERIAALEQERATTEDAARLEEIEDQLLDLSLELEKLPDIEQVSALAAPPVKGTKASRFINYRLKGRNEREQLESLYAFATAFPELCNIELRHREIIDRLNKGDCFRSKFPEDQPQDPNSPESLPRPPGLELFWDVSTKITKR